MGHSRIVWPSAVHRQGGLRASPDTPSYTLPIHTRLSPVTTKSLASPQRPYVHPLASPPSPLSSLPSSPTRSRRDMSSSTSFTAMPPLNHRRLVYEHAPRRQLNTSRSPADLPHTPTRSPVFPVAKVPALPHLPTSPTLKVPRSQKVREIYQTARVSPQKSTRVADEDADRTPATPTSPRFKRFPPITPTSPTLRRITKQDQLSRRYTAQKVGTAPKASLADEADGDLAERFEKALAITRERRPSATPLPFALRAPDARARRPSLSSPLPSPTRSPRKDIAEEQPHPQPRPGPFQLLKGIQSGAFGKTLAARDLSSRRVVCLKVFDKARVLARQHVHALRRELAAYQRVAGSDKCPWVMELHAVFQTDEKIFFVMDLMDSDLLETIRRGISKDQARRWMAQVTTGIQALHDMGVIHRDVKSENILIDYQGSARLADLGTAYVHSHALSPEYTYTAEYVGTRPYMAPEVVSIGNLLQRGLEPAVHRRSYGVQVDWWGLGCVFWDMLAGENLFQDDCDLEEYIEKFCQGKGPQYLRSRAPDMTQWEERLLSGLLDVSEDRRFLFHEVKLEPYFKRNGLNEFDSFTDRTRVSRNLYRSERAHYQLYDSRGLEVLDLFDTTREYTKRLRRRLIESDGTASSSDPERMWRPFRWINPKGMWSEWSVPEKQGL